MNTCDVCFEPTWNRKRTSEHNWLLCSACRWHHDYVTHQSYADAVAEEQAINEYVKWSSKEYRDV